MSPRCPPEGCRWCSAGGRLHARQGRGKPELRLRRPHAGGQRATRRQDRNTSARPPKPASGAPRRHAAPRRRSESRPGPSGHRSHAWERRPQTSSSSEGPPRRPLLPRWPAEPLPAPRGTFRPGSFLLPDFHFCTLSPATSSALQTAPASAGPAPGTQHPGPSPSRLPPPRAPAPAAALGDVSKPCRAPRRGNRHVGRFPKTVWWAGDPGVRPAPRPGPAEAPRPPSPPHKTRRTLLTRASFWDAVTHTVVPVVLRQSALWVRVGAPAPPPTRQRRGLSRDPAGASALQAAAATRLFYAG